MPSFLSLPPPSHRTQARARQRNAEARKEMANAMAFIRENGPSKQQEDEEEEDDEYRDQARRALRQAQKAFKALVEEEVSFLSDGYVRRLQLVVAGVEPAKQGQGEYRDNEEERDAGSSWLDRRQRRARENERVVKRLFEQQCKVRQD